MSPRLPLGRRGSALAQVLVLAATAAAISASVLRARYQPALTNAAALERLRDDLALQSALHKLNAAWARSGSCASDGSQRLYCQGSGCRCRCVLDGAVDIVSVREGNLCRLTLSRKGD